MFRTLAALTVLLFATTAQAESFPLDAPVAGHPGKTWRDIVKLVVTDIQPDGTGSEVIDLPYVDILEDEDAPRPTLPVRVLSVQTQPFEAEGRQLTAVTLDLGEAEGWAAHVEALALIDENLNLLDVVNVGQDMMTELRGNPIRISDQDDALLTYSEHFNSNQTYGSYALLMVRDGKWQTIDTIGTLSDRWCGHERVQSLAVTAGEGQGYRPLTLVVSDDLHQTGENEECGDEIMQPGFVETYTTTYGWSASMGLYVADGEAFAELDSLNAERY